MSMAAVNLEQSANKLKLLGKCENIEFWYKKKTTTTHDRVQVVHGVRALEGKTVIIISLESALHLLKSITCCTCTR